MVAVFLFVGIAGVAGLPSPEDGLPSLRVVNYCPSTAHVVTRKLDPYSLVDKADFYLDALESATIPCVDGRRVKAKFNNSCETFSEHIYCGLDPTYEAVVKIECDDASAFGCSASEIHEPCAALEAVETAFCPARSTQATTSKEVDDSPCGGEGLLKVGSKYVFDKATTCPVCVCDTGTSCVGSECTKCGESGMLVARSVDASCIPNKWITAAPTQADAGGGDKPSSGNHPKPTYRAPVYHSKPTHSPTLVPTTVPDFTRRRARRASSMAVLVIAVLAGLIAACAIRQTVVKQRRAGGYRSGGAGLYVDIPSTEAPMAFRSQHAASRQQPMRGGQQRSRGGVELMAHGNEGL